MNQRQEILDAWAKYSASAYRSSQFVKAQGFFQLIEDRTDMCWEDLVSEFRNHYYDAYDTIVPVLLSTNDPLIVHNVARFADLNSAKEADTVKNIVANADPVRQQATLQAFAAVPALQPVLMKKAQLPDTVRVALGLTAEKPVAKPA
jgi:hypothetical protein